MAVSSLSSSQFVVKATAETPEVTLDDMAMVFSFTGNCYPPNPDEFFAPVMRWITDFFARTPVVPELVINFQLNYLNSSSDKYLLQLLMLVKDHHTKFQNIRVNWFYFPHDAEMKELGETFIQYVELPIQLVPLT